jgi:hypothetical protein
MRPASLAAALATVAIAAAMAASANGQAARPAAKPAQPQQGKAAPPYVIIERSTDIVLTAGANLTVFCPAGHRPLGAGYTAVVRNPPKAGAAVTFTEAGLDWVRSMPDMAGTGWQVSGISQDAVRLHQPWRLVVRVVCLQTP